MAFWRGQEGSALMSGLTHRQMALGRVTTLNAEFSGKLVLCHHGMFFMIWDSRRTLLSSAQQQAAPA